jgi:hypothetical protein
VVYDAGESTFPAPVPANGGQSTKVPDPPVHLPPPAGPQGTFVESDGGHGPGQAPS